MQCFYLNLAVLSSSTIACINGPLGDFHNEVHKELQETMKDLHEDTMERLSEWHEVTIPKSINETGQANLDFRTAPNPEETHDSLNNNPFSNEPFFRHPFANLNNMIHSVFNNMGAFFGGLGGGHNHDLVETNVLTSDSGTEYNKTLHNITNEEGKLVGKRTTYNFESENSDDDSSFYQVHSSISFSDIASVPDSLENEQYYDDGSDSDDEVVNSMDSNKESGNSSDDNSNELETLFQQNEKSSYRRPSYKDSDRLNLNISPVDM